MAALAALSDRIQEELRRYVFNELPIHLIHLESAQLWDRHAVLADILPNFNAMAAQDLPQGVTASLLNSIPSYKDTANIRDFIRVQLKYAVLSDQWGEPKPAYGDIPSLACIEDIPSRYNIAKFCDIARSFCVEYAWVDSCCIDRSNDAELNQSIRSIYRWYANSSICIAHLAESMSIQDISQDSWFRRGWSLLQLLAPERIKFYSRTWDKLAYHFNDKQSPEILAAIQEATSISPQEIQQFDPRARNTYQISKRMRWAINRSTTLVEDKAYSLMGVFGVVIDAAYGEGGPRAFSRLFKEIVQFSNSPEVVNWVGKPAAGLSLRSLAYPSSPDAFIGSHDIVGLVREEPITLASNGLTIKLIVLPATPVLWEESSLALLKCFEVQVRVDCLAEFKPGNPGEGSKVEYALGGWNFSTKGGRCQRSGDLFEALLLYRVVRGDQAWGWSRIPTRSFIRLELRATNLPRGKRWEDYMKTVVL